MRFFRLFALTLALLAGTAMAAESYPDKSRPLKIIIAQGPGSTSDLIARSLAKGVTDATGWPAIVDYRPGAEGIVGVQALMNSPTDGYSLLVVSSSSTVLNPVLVPNLPYDPLREEGVADYELNGWYASYFPAHTPPDVVAAMREILRRAVKSPGVSEALAKGSMDPFDVAGDEINAVIRKEIEVSTKVVRAANLAPAMAPAK